MVGESGAGKSLIGSSLIGLMPPGARMRDGTIRFDGREIQGLGGEAMRKVRGRRIGTIFQDPLTSLNPLFTVGRQISETIAVQLEVEPCRGGSARRGMVGARRAARSRAALRQLSPRVLRRHAPARGGRARPVRRARPRHRRRAHDRPRRVRAGPDHRAAARARPRAQHGAAAHHARYGRHRRDHGPGRRALRRPHRRDRQDGGHPAAALAPLYRRADALHPAPRRAGCAAAADGGRDAAPVRDAVDALRLQPALPGDDRALPRFAAAARSCRKDRGRMLPSRRGRRRRDCRRHPGR